MLSQCTFVMSRWTSRLPPFLRRAVQVEQMEMDSALSQMYSLCLKPSLVSKMSRARKMTKGHYYRDDPAFLMLQLVFIVVVSVAQWLLLGMSRSLVGILFSAIAWYVLSGLGMACVWRAVAVMYLSPSSTSTQGGVLTGATSALGVDSVVDYLRPDLDWRYAFDVHCNGYFTFFIWTEVIAYFLAPVMSVSWVSNAVVGIGTTTYLYSVFLGYLEIPSLSYQQRLLYPVLIVGVLFLLLSFSDINVGVKLWLQQCAK
ncbi:putative UNC-50 family [Leishmania utingensis]|uniref:UNC-50 family n=1 Tax=Leishmania utingensis TaxID=653362 RepID=A0AAW2ZZC8_9TRYP